MLCFYYIVLNRDISSCRYILSTSVVKDLVVLLDIGQQNGTTFMPAKNIITELFDTFGIGDSVNVVTFDSTNATLLQPSSVPSSYLITSLN